MNPDDRTGLWTRQIQRLRRKIRARDGDQCGICGLVMFFGPKHHDLAECHGIAASLDHITPVCRGGSHFTDNLRLAHRFCNSYRGDLKAREHAAAPQTRKYAQRVLMPLVRLGLITHLDALEISPSAYRRVSARSTALNSALATSTAMLGAQYQAPGILSSMPLGAGR